MMGFVTSLAVPAPKTRPDYDVVAEYQGLKLGRISDAVPYCTYPFLAEFFGRMLLLTDLLRLIQYSGLAA